MSENYCMAPAGSSKDVESLKTVFDTGMKLFDAVENGQEATNSEVMQMNIKKAITNFEKATNLVSMAGMFSKNENVEELPTETLQYLLLPALLGTLTLKLTNRARTDVIAVAEVYFRDFLQRCKDYGITDVEIPQPSASNGQSNADRPLNEKEKLISMVSTRESKIKRYKEEKELKEKVSMLSKAMSHHGDDETKREYFTALVQQYVNQALDELASIEQEKPILEYMAKHAGETRQKQREHVPLKPVIITRDAVQKAVFGAGYPSLPTMTIEEFYDQRVREGVFPGTCKIPHQTLKSVDEDPDEAQQIRKEELVEQDDPEELQRLRNMDEYKDEHRRGEGNRYNRS